MTTLLDGPAVPGSLRQMNRLTVLRLLRQMGPTTKPALAKHTGISRPTISKVIDDLEIDGLAERVGLAQPAANGGKPGALYRFNAGGVRSGAVFLRVDIAQVAIIDGNARVLAHIDQPLGDDRRPEPVLALISATMKELMLHLGVTSDDLLGVGVGVPGLTSYHTGVVHFAPHLPEWRDVALCDLLAKELGTAVWVDNDCHVQALAERHFGIGQDGMEFISVQSGIGLSAAFYLDGTLYRGASDTAGEVGHMTVHEHGRRCDCGNTGCWETIASTTALVEATCATKNDTLALPDWLQMPTLAVRTWGTIRELDPATVTAVSHAIFAAAANGQPEAITQVRDHARHFAVGIANLINILNPQRIIIWGDSVLGGQPFLDVVRAEVRRRALRGPSQNCEIVFTQLDQDVGLVGTGSLAIDALFGGVSQ